MNLLFKLKLFCFLIISITCITKNEDLVVDLAGFPSYFKGPLYAGYLDITEEHSLYYWFIPSSNSPKNDPVVLWLNGGPGCSSMDGALYENGPFLFKDNSTEFRDEENPYAWTKFANVIYLDAPVGVFN